MWHEFDPLLRRGHEVASCLRLLVPRLAAAAPVALGDANDRDANTGNDDAGDAAVAPSSGQSAGSGTTRAQTCNSCGDGVANEHHCPPA